MENERLTRKIVMQFDLKMIIDDIKSLPELKKGDFIKIVLIHCYSEIDEFKIIAIKEMILPDKESNEIFHKNIKSLEFSRDLIQNSQMRLEEFKFLECLKSLHFYYWSTKEFYKYHELQYNLLRFENSSIYEIGFWLLNVTVYENKNKDLKFYLKYIKKLREKQNNEDIKYILLKIYRRI